MDDTVNKIVEYCTRELCDSEPYLHGKNERSMDLYTCGYVDGRYNEMIAILDLAGIEHDFEIQE